ncbi:MAG: hypothetical protein IKT38_00425 [Clostridia bacterium]|nr:hypothetical protein [Clostridia bacterium]
MSISVETKNIKEFTRVYQAEYIYSCGYYSQNCWVDDNRLILTRMRNLPKDKFCGGTDLVLVDVENKTEKVIFSQELMGISYVVHKNIVYFVKTKNQLCSIDVETLEEKILYTCETDIVQPHITADGGYIAWFDAEGKTMKQTCRRIDLKTCEVEKMLEVGFLPPFYVANHFMICPTDPDKIFFAHEGDTTYITNRLWMFEKGKEPYNLAKQRLDENGNLIDCFGHESWVADGKGLYFVKYDVSPSKPTGIGYVDLETREVKILYTKNKYWHVCAAPNGKYLAADLGPNDLDENNLMNSGVCLINIENNTEEIIVNVKNHRSHPGHPHPQFNPSCSRMCFHDAFADGTLSVGIVDIK